MIILLPKAEQPSGAGRPEVLVTGPTERFGVHLALNRTVGSYGASYTATRAVRPSARASNCKSFKMSTIRPRALF